MLSVKIFGIELGIFIIGNPLFSLLLVLQTRQRDLSMFMDFISRFWAMKILYQDRSDHLLALSRFALLNIVYYVYIILTMDAVLFFFYRHFKRLAL